MTSYQTRRIRFAEIVSSGNWQVKVYTIAKTGDFAEPAIYQRAMDRLPEWLKMKNGFDDTHDHRAFLIVHAGTEGVFSLINWWVGTNMLNTHIFLAEYAHPTEFRQISGTGLAPCIWELEVIDFERRAWMEYILKPAAGPDFVAYLEQRYDGEM